MPSATATYQDGRTFTYTDGVLGGDHLLVGLADATCAAVPQANAMAEGPTVKTAEYPTDPWAFVALARLVYVRDRNPTLSFSEDWPKAGDVPQPILE